MRAIWVLLLTLAANAMATTLRVDGPGDGDGDSSDDFDSIAEAFDDLAASGLGSDGSSDEVLITVDRLVEPTHFAINPGSPSEPVHAVTVSDSLTIEGDGDKNGIPCALSETEGAEEFPMIGFYLAPSQSLTLRDLTVMASGGNRYGLLVFPADRRSPLDEISVTLDHFLFTAARGDLPADPDDPNVTGLFAQYDPRVAVYIDTSDSDSHLNCRVVDSAVAHQQLTPFWISADKASIEVIRTRCVRNGNAYPGGEYHGGNSYDVGLGIACERGGSVRIEESEFSLNKGGGLAFAPPASGETLDAWVGPGCQFSHNGLHNFNGYSDAGLTVFRYPPTEGAVDLTLAGTPERPIVFDDNGNRAIDASFHGSAEMICSDLIITRSELGSVALDFGSASTRATFTHCLFAGVHGSATDWTGFGEPFFIPGYVTNMTARGTSSTENLISFQDCTFHRIQASPEYQRSPIELEIERVGAEFKNCIFSGGVDEDGTLIAGCQVDFDHCAGVLEGSDALGNFGQSALSQVTYDFLTNNDPGYANITVPPNSFSFDVTNPAFAHAGPAGGPLTGWGDYVGVLSINGLEWR